MADGVMLLYETRIDPRFPLARRELKALCEVILEGLGLEGRSFSLSLVDDREIARINSEFLGCDGPTNILSFPSGADENEANLGDLALSIDTLARETDLYGQRPVEHLARLLAHGILHLAGYDHGEEMFDLTDMAVDRVLLEYCAMDGGE